MAPVKVVAHIIHTAAIRLILDHLTGSGKRRLTVALLGELEALRRED